MVHRDLLFNIFKSVDRVSVRVGVKVSLTLALTPTLTLILTLIPYTNPDSKHNPNPFIYRGPLIQMFMENDQLKASILLL